MEDFSLYLYICPRDFLHFCDTTFRISTSPRPSRWASEVPRHCVPERTKLEIDLPSDLFNFGTDS